MTISLPLSTTSLSSRSIVKAFAAFATVILTMLGTSCVSASNTDCKTPWPEWEQFKRTFITTDGRVIDHSSNIKHTVSEGQAYAMFFALTANDRSSFQNLLTWTENNLANGDLTTHLPPGGSLYPITNGSSTLAIRHCNFCDGLITTTKTRAGKNYSRRRSKSFLVHPPKDILPTGYAIILIKGLCQTYKDPNKAMVVTMLSEFTYGLAC